MKLFPGRVRPLLAAMLTANMLISGAVAAWAIEKGAVEKETVEKEVAESYEGRPVAVMTLPGYDALLKDVDFVGKLVDRPALPAMIEGGLSVFTQGKGLEGLDKSRSIGVIVNLNADQEPEPLVFLPVTSLKKLMGSLEGLTGGAIEPDDAGIYAIEAGPTSIYLIEKGKWAFIARRPESLKETPADPLALLGGLNEEYEIGLRILVENIPEAKKQEAIKQLEAGLKAGMEKQDSESEEELESRKKIATNAMNQMVQLIHETDHVTLGWKLDFETGSSFMDLKVIAKAGTKLAKQSAQLAKTTSQHAGFLLLDAAIQANLAAKMTDKEDIDRVTAWIEAARIKAMQGIEKDEKLKDDDARAKAKEIVGDLLDVAKETAEAGTFDGGVVVELVPGEMTVVLGGTVANGKKLEGALKKLAEMAQSNSDFQGVQWDVEQHEGVHFHKFTVPVEDDKAKDVLGDPLQVVLGTGKKSFYVAFGKQPEETLKNVIDKSKAAGEKAVSPFEGVVALGKTLNFAAAQEDDPKVVAIAEALEKSGENAHIRATASSVEGGVLYRLELEKGVLTAIGRAAVAGMGNNRRDGGL
jgi:hypothetical protein